jgi:hypothetical protein
MEKRNLNDVKSTDQEAHLIGSSLPFHQSSFEKIEQSLQIRNHQTKAPLDFLL